MTLCADDMGEAPSRLIMERLRREGAAARAFDPEAMDECRRIHGVRLESFTF